jgi:hypothetical protein
MEKHDGPRIIAGLILGFTVGYLIIKLTMRGRD